MVESFDLICFSEAKIDVTDVISFPGYCNIAQPRKQKFLRKSGGISVYFKNKWENYIRQIDTESDYVLWLEIDKSLFRTDENLIFGAIYVPPESSKFLVRMSL